jgi:hypothetical protein
VHGRPLARFLSASATLVEGHVSDLFARHIEPLAVMPFKF